MREAQLPVVSKDYRQRMSNDNLDAVIAALRCQIPAPSLDLGKMRAGLRAECVLCDELESFRRSQLERLHHFRRSLLNNEEVEAILF